MGFICGENRCFSPRLFHSKLCFVSLAEKRAPIVLRRPAFWTQCGSQTGGCLGRIAQRILHCVLGCVAANEYERGWLNEARPNGRIARRATRCFCKLFQRHRSHFGAQGLAFKFPLAIAYFWPDFFNLGARQKEVEIKHAFERASAQI